MFAIGIDPGTHCGWAVFDNIMSSSGVWELKGGRYEGGGMRYIRLRQYLEEICKYRKVDMIFFEEVRRHMGTDAAHIYGGIVATIMAFCEEYEIPYTGIPVGTVKKFATGKGNAGKDDMVARAKITWPHIVIDSEDQADAMWILAAGLHEIRGRANSNESKTINAQGSVPTPQENG